MSEVIDALMGMKSGKVPGIDSQWPLLKHWGRGSPY